jgi:predicted RNA binding protein YcfA (HicA-like mRNA interferase family)
MTQFPSMKARALLAVLQREPLGYRILRQRGSHRILVAPGRPRVIYAFPDSRTLPPAAVRRVLVVDVGLEEDEALDLL